MGGDRAPDAVVDGAVSAARGLPAAQIILVGDEAVLQPLLASHHVPSNVRVQHAPQVVDMCEAPGQAIRGKPKSSIAIGMRLVRDGQAQAFVSAGNSGAMMAAAMLILKSQPGVDRPAIATLLPTRTGGRVVMLDGGATADCKPIHLVQFARMGARYASVMLNTPTPRVGLISIGEEPSKGNELTKETHQLLLTSDLNFVGNIEPKELVSGHIEVGVADGFVGNLVLKTGEGFGEMLLGLLKDELTRTWYTKLLAWAIRPAFRRVLNVIDYAETGGALLLGVNGVVVIGHGRSNARAIENAIRVGLRAAEGRVAESPVTADDVVVNSV